jgi:hypothetical protein
MPNMGITAKLGQKNSISEHLDCSGGNLATPFLLGIRNKESL